MSEKSEEKDLTQSDHGSKEEKHKKKKKKKRVKTVVKEQPVKDIVPIFAYKTVFKWWQKPSIIYQ